MFKKVDPKLTFPKMEEEILKFWEKNKIFEKSLEKKSPKGEFVFYEGPPTANGKPGLHHVLARAFKDIIPRYKTMKGYHVPRKAGWDTHGLPVEIQVEKELGLKNKQDIENIVPGNPRESIIEFNKKCKESAWEYKDLWEKMTRRMAYWVDMKNPYITYDNKYMESIWWIFAQIAKLKNEKNESLVYKGHKVVPYCYRCGTALSSHEVAQGYQEVEDNSVYVKFKAKPNPERGIDDNTYFLVWTTTPWTLPGNVALAVNSEIDYILFENKDDQGKIETYIFSLDYFLKKYPSTVKTLKETETPPALPEFPYEKGRLEGKDLLKMEYDSLYKVENSTGKKAHYIVAGDFVSTTDGTGIVHIAPAFGEDDAQVAKDPEYNLPTFLTVDEAGKINVDVPGKGIPVKKKNERNRYAADDLIIEDLRSRNLLFKEEKYKHEYPFCWRCETPLIYYAKPSWFIRMSSLSDALVKNNEKINWIPEYIKDGRFGEWLRGVKDWAISRERYWGTPLPIWECENCDQIKIIESIKELEELSSQNLDDLHKPFIDDVKFKCSCGGEMKRVPEVMDVWFDSGSMPLAQYHYPHNATSEEKEGIESGKLFPADYISEAIDQTRGWFYTLHAIATLLNKSEKIPAGFAYKSVICLGLILDAKGKKMSKSKGNVIEPMEIMEQYGADMLRWMLFTINQPGTPKRFDPKGMKDIMNRVFRMLWNSYSFFVMYADIDKWQPKDKEIEPFNLLDKWILAEFNVLASEVNNKLDNYDIYGAAELIEKFIDNLSNWYIRRSRKRFWKSEDDIDKEGAYQTLHFILVELCKLMAPFTPFISEEIYKNLTSKESVHLADFPVAKKVTAIQKDLVENMRKLREVISTGLQLRANEKIKVRQPLSKVTLKDKFNDEMNEIIKEELNVKKVAVDQAMADNIMLDNEITEELKLEGYAREIIRSIQEMRKEAGYEVDNRIEVGYDGLQEVFDHFGSLITKEVLATSLHSGLIANADLQKDFSIEDHAMKISIKR